MSFAPLKLAALSAVPPERAGLAAALFNTAMQIGGAVGLAAVTSVLTAGTDLASLLTGNDPDGVLTYRDAQKRSGRRGLTAGHTR